jgi:hypothetical protein
LAEDAWLKGGEVGGDVRELWHVYRACEDDVDCR